MKVLSKASVYALRALAYRKSLDDDAETLLSESIQRPGIHRSLQAVGIYQRWERCRAGWGARAGSLSIWAGYLKPKELQVEPLPVEPEMEPGYVAAE